MLRFAEAYQHANNWRWITPNESIGEGWPGYKVLLPSILATTRSYALQSDTRTTHI